MTNENDDTDLEERLRRLATASSDLGTKADQISDDKTRREIVSRIEAVNKEITNINKKIESEGYTRPNLFKTAYYNLIRFLNPKRKKNTLAHRLISSPIMGYAYTVGLGFVVDFYANQTGLYSGYHVTEFMAKYLGPGAAAISTIAGFAVEKSHFLFRNIAKVAAFFAIGGAIGLGLTTGVGGIIDSIFSIDNHGALKVLNYGSLYITYSGSVLLSNFYD